MHPFSAYEKFSSQNIKDPRLVEIYKKYSCAAKDHSVIKNKKKRAT
jgi:hypothetical protein